VSLGAVAERPRFFIVPTNVVAALLFVGHRAWLSMPKKDGSPRKDSAIRAISNDQIEPYEEAWSLLDAPAHEAPIVVPPWVLEHGRSEIGWPEGHPGF